MVLLRWLIGHGEPEAENYADQIDRIHVSSECTCGCPSITFALDGSPRSGDDDWLIVADLAGDSPEGTQINVILHAHAGALYELEIFSVDGSGPISLPSPGDLKAWEDAAV
jgi:hypothetical protein